MSAKDGHPGVWGPGMENPEVRELCDLLAEPAVKPRPIVPARAYRPRSTR